MAEALEELPQTSDPMSGISYTNIMVDIRQKKGDGVIYFKELDFITGGKVVKKINLALPIIAAVLIGIGIAIIKKFIISNDNWIVFLGISSVMFWAIYSFAVIKPVYDYNMLHYIFSFLAGIKTRFHHKEKDDPKRYQGFYRRNEDGSLSMVVGFHGRIGKTSFQSDIFAEREIIESYRDNLNGIVEVQLDTYGKQSFRNQRKRLQTLITNDKTPDYLVELAKRESSFYRKVLSDEKVEKQYGIFTTHNEDEFDRMIDYINDLIELGVISIDLDFEEDKAKEILSLFRR